MKACYVYPEQGTTGQGSQLRGRFNCERNEPPRITNLRVQAAGRMSRREQERKGKRNLANDAAEHRGRKRSLANDAAEHFGTIRGLFIQLAHRSSRRRARKFPSAATLQRASQMLAVRCNYLWAHMANASKNSHKITLLIYVIK